MPPNKIATGKIVKLDEDKHLVFGWASIIKDVDGKILLDRQNDYIDSEEELEKAAYDYVLKSRDGGEMHIRRGVSKMVESVVLTEEKQRMLGIPTGSTPTGWWIGFKVNDDRVWEQVKKGEYAGFSVHGTGRRESTELPISKITEVGKGESAGHPFRGNQWTRGISGGGKPQSAPDTVGSEFLRHSGYDVLPKPTSDLGVAKITGAPISWLMPESLHSTLVPLFAELRAMEDGLFSASDDIALNYKLKKALGDLGFNEDEVSIVMLGLKSRSRLMERNGGDKGGVHQYGSHLAITSAEKQVGTEEAQDAIPDDAIPAIRMTSTALKGVFSSGRIKTQFETGTSRGVNNPDLRAAQETAMLSLHPSVNPKKRPIYGFVLNNTVVSNLETLKSVEQYGNTTVVLKQGVRGRTSWVQGDSLNSTILLSSMEEPTYHGLEDFSGARSPVDYYEAQIHGGVKIKDIDYIVMPRYKNYGGVMEDYNDKEEFASEHKISQEHASKIRTWDEEFGWAQNVKDNGLPSPLDRDLKSMGYK